LLGLGNCLVLKSGGHDGDALQAALRCFEDCLAATSSGETKSVARYNHERARLLLLQVLSSPDSKDHPTGSDSAQPPPRPEPQESNLRPGEAEAGVDGQPNDPSGAGSVQPESGRSPMRTDGTPPPGAGNLPPIPDQAESAALSPRDAEGHLEKAFQNIARERQAFHRRIVGPLAATVPIW
jgi:hypothetical protein